MVHYAMQTFYSTHLLVSSLTAKCPLSPY